MTLRLATIVMAHPSRAEYAQRLAKRIRGTIVYDPDPLEPRNPWRCARKAWEVGASKKGVGHVLVVQEDVIVRDDFVKHVRRALSAKPDRICSFYLGWMPAVTAQQALIAAGRCAAWVQGHHASFVPTVALAMPTHLARSLVEFEDILRPVADDDVVGRWTRHHGLPWYASIPSLADHDDSAPSLMSTGQRDRRAMCWIDQADGMLIDWTRD